MDVILTDCYIEPMMKVGKPSSTLLVRVFVSGPLPEYGSVFGEDVF